jgi:hypothetical protein
LLKDGITYTEKNDARYKVSSENNNTDGGSETVTLDIENMPSHWHSVVAMMEDNSVKDIGLHEGWGIESSGSLYGIGIPSQNEKKDGEDNYNPSYDKGELYA